MAQVLRRLTPTSSEQLLVDASTGDDAAVWKLDDDRALVFTADFITPLVDDARTWGRIAAANSVSDIYAMGGRPLMALNLVGWNTDELSTDLLSEVMQGASEIAVDAGMVVAGGHTVDDPEPKFGWAVVGEVHPDKLLTNAGLQPNQDIILTKPLGIGVISTALKQGQAPQAVVDEAVASMTKLNAEAAAIALNNGSTGGTDVTGFGLLGHLGRAAKESAVDVTLQVAAVPILDGVHALADAGFIPGGSRRNVESIAAQLDTSDTKEDATILLADAQTSGGLVFGVSPDVTSAVLSELAQTGHRAAQIGTTATGSGRLKLV